MQGWQQFRIPIPSSVGDSQLFSRRARRNVRSEAGRQISELPEDGAIRLNGIHVSLAGSCYHPTPYCPLLMAGQKKARGRGHIVTRIVCVSMNEARERRRTPCRGCVSSRPDPGARGKSR